MRMRLHAKDDASQKKLCLIYLESSSRKVSTYKAAGTPVTDTNQGKPCSLPKLASTSQCIPSGLWKDAAVTQAPRELCKLPSISAESLTIRPSTSCRPSERHPPHDREMPWTSARRRDLSRVNKFKQLSCEFPVEWRESINRKTPCNYVKTPSRPTAGEMKINV